MAQTLRVIRKADSPQGSAHSAMNCPAPSISPRETTLPAAPKAASAGGAEKRVVQLIAQQAAVQPNALALSAGTRQATYAQLESDAAQWAHHLRALGVGPESLVGLCLERSPDFVVAALAIMQCGAAYLPLEATPASREKPVDAVTVSGKFQG